MLILKFLLNQPSIFKSAKKYKYMALLLLCLIFGAGLMPSVYAEEDQKAAHDFPEISRLLSRIDLNTPGLEKVKASIHDPVLAASELLAYYRSRDFVKHPIDRQSKADMFGKCADEKDMKIADDALKHIFVGQPAYPSHFCGDDIDWATKPVADNEWVWQLNRMSFWEAMGRAYWHTGNEKYAREWCVQLIDWTEKNPRDSQHDYAWRSIEAGIRGYRWTGLFQRFSDAPSFTPEVLVAFLNSCYDHAAYLMTKYSKGSNWGLMEAEGLAFIAITFPEFQDSKIWRDEAVMRLNNEIKNQVYSDGHQRELAMGYHIGSIGWFTRTFDLARMNGMKEAFPEDYLQTIEKMCEVPVKLGFPDGTTPQFGDSWSGKPGQNWEKIRYWSQLFDRQDFLYVATEGQEGITPDATAFALPESGLYSMRSGWDKDDVCLVLKCGPDGGGHCQPDNGTFELYAGGRHLMPDAGSYIYSGDPENRAWFRQTKVHQTLTLNGENSAYAPRLLLWEPGNDLDVLVVENKSYNNLTHRRAVLFVEKKFFVIVDEALGEFMGDIDIHFQFAPGEAILDKENLSMQSGFTNGWNVFVQTEDQEGISLEEEEGQVSFEYTKKEPRPAFRYRIHREERKKSGLRFITVVAPFQEKPPKLDARLIGEPEIGAKSVELEVLADGITKRFKYDLKE
jgi:heparan-sulfate lyase